MAKPGMAFDADHNICITEKPAGRCPGGLQIIHREKSVDDLDDFPGSLSGFSDQPNVPFIDDGTTLLPRYPINPINQHVERLLTFTEVIRLKEQKTRTKPDHAWTKKVRVVCARCNKGWMNDVEIEIAARPFLTPLICTTPRTMTITAALAIARWVA